MPNKELIEKCLLGDKKIQCLGIEYEEGNQKYTLNEYLQREQLTHAILIISEEIKNLKLPEVPLWATLDNVEIKGADIVYKVAIEDVLKAVLDLLSGENT